MYLFQHKFIIFFLANLSSVSRSRLRMPRKKCDRPFHKGDKLRAGGNRYPIAGSNGHNECEACVRRSEKQLSSVANNQQSSAITVLHRFQVPLQPVIAPIFAPPQSMPGLVISAARAAEISSDLISDTLQRFQQSVGYKAAMLFLCLSSTYACLLLFCTP
jgi:hypothetical protein